MNYSNSLSGIGIGFHLHFIFGGVLILGLIFLVIWANKVLDKKDLKTWTIWLIVIGLVGTLLTGHWGMNGWSSMMHRGFSANNVDWREMADHMNEEDHEEINTPEEWKEHMIEEMGEHMGFDKK